MANSHVIGQQFLDLEFHLESDRDAFRLESDISDIVRLRVLPAMSVIFDRFAGPDQAIRLDRLKLDVGQIDAERLDEDFTRRVCEAIELQLIELTDPVEQTHRSTDRAVSPQLAAERNSQSGHVLELWHFTLLRGHLPWWAASRSATDLASNVREELSKLGKLPTATTRLLQSNDAAVKRVTRDHPLLEQVLRLADHSFAEVLCPLLDVVTVGADSSSVSTLQRERLCSSLRIAALTECLNGAGRGVELRLRDVLQAALIWSTQENQPESIVFARSLVSSMARSTEFGAIPQSVREVVLQTIVALSEPSGSLDDSPRVPLDGELRRAEAGRAHGLASETRLEPRETAETVAQSSQPKSAPEPEIDVPDVATKEASNEHDRAENRPAIPAHAMASGSTALTGNSTEAREHVDEPTDADLERQQAVGREPELATSNRTKTPETAHSVGDRAASETVIPAPLKTESNANVVSPDDAPAEPTKSSRRMQAEATGVAEGESIYVDDAGLILLAPFLQAHFEKLELFSDGKFTDNAGRDSAIHQLRFLATGDEEMPEYFLVTAKILCGLAPDEPVVHAVARDERAKTESHNLLSAVIRHWGALKNASPDGLRETFLRREGRLTRKSDGWRLRVDSRSYDLLLDRLPWPLSVISLPWMPEILRVDWV